jgi:hypothetical protein
VKQLKRIGWALLGVFLVFFIAVFILLRFYEDEIGTYAIEKLKTQVTTEFRVGQVGLAFWKTFPNASVELNEIFVQEKGGTSDTLLYAEALYLKFNLLDLFRGNYRVDEVDVVGGMLDLRVDDTGNNWEVWKDSGGEVSNFEIELEEIALTDTRVLYHDIPNKFALNILANQVSGNGNFSAQSMDLEMELDAFVERIESKGDAYLEKQTVSGKLLMQADIDKGAFAFKPGGSLTVGDFAFSVQGKVNESGAGDLDIYVESNEQLIEDAWEVLPSNIRKSLLGYKVSGDFSAKAKIGRGKDVSPVMLEIELAISDGTLRIKEEGVALEDVQTDFYYIRGGKQDQIRLKSFSCNLDRSHVEASGTIIGFETPRLDVNLVAEMQLKDIRDFLDLQEIEVCEGSVKAEAALNGTLRYVEADTAFNWREVLATGQAKVEGATLKMRNSNRLFNEMFAEFTFDKQSALIRQFSGLVNGSDFALSGSLHNIVPFLFEPKAHVFLDASLKSNILDFTQLVEEESSTTNDSDYELLFPALLDFNLNCSIDKFIFRKFEATDVKGLAVLENGALTIDPVSFNTADGKLNAQLVLAPISTTAYRMNCLAKVVGIHVDKVFTEFENFGQTFIQDRHLKGVANANVQFRAVLTNALELPSDKIESVIDVTIENGELNNLETLQEIADYLRNNKWVAPFVDEDRFAERMQNVKFSKLENIIEIRNRVITIPLMDVRSSAMDISAKGTHTFDHAIDYAFGFNLRDLLVRKDKDWTEVDDGLGKSMYISMKGTVDNPVYAMDRELAKEIRKESMEAEKQNMKALLKDEFGLFKKDDSVGGYKENSQNTGGSTISVEWEENDVKPNQPDNSKPKQKQVAPEKQTEKQSDKQPEKQKKTPKWLEEKDN